MKTIIRNLDAGSGAAIRALVWAAVFSLPLSVSPAANAEPVFRTYFFVGSGFPEPHEVEGSSKDEVCGVITPGHPYFSQEAFQWHDGRFQQWFGSGIRCVGTSLVFAVDTRNTGVARCVEADGTIANTSVWTLNTTKERCTCRTTPSNPKVLVNGQCVTPTAQNCPLNVGGVCSGGPNNGPSCPTCGNPINPANGNKLQTELLYRGLNGFALSLTYNTQDEETPEFGRRWRHSFDRRIVANGAAQIVAFRGDGKAIGFSSSGGSWVANADISDRLTELQNPPGTRIGWRLDLANGDEVETYGAAGLLLSITTRAGLTTTFAYSDGTKVGPNGGFLIDADGQPTIGILPAGKLIRAIDPYGRTLTFQYDVGSRISRVIDPAGGIYRFTYDYNRRLELVTWPGGAVRTYHYNEPVNTAGINQLFALTGITDENGARFATYKYDPQGRAVSSEHAGGAGLTTVTYNADGSSTVLQPLGSARTYGFQQTFTKFRNTAITGPACPGCGPASQTFDANGNPASHTDWNGNRTNYAYDLVRNLESLRTEGLTSGGAATPQTRTISTQWHPTFRMPVQTAEPLRITTSVYDVDGTACGAGGALCSKTIQATTDASGSQGFSAMPHGAPRVWTYTYNANGSVLTVNGPRTDVADLTTYTYYANDDADPGKRGNVATVTNAAGHVTQITAYNAHGQPLTTIDPNGLTTTLAYDARQRLESRTVGSETTSYGYDGVGQLTRVTLPDGSYLSYTYDPAHRLTGLSDNLGNRITYTLDAMGNRTAEQVRDPANALVQARSREFNSLNRLFRELGAQGQVTEYAHDDQGNVVAVKDPLERVTANQYDALNRLKQVTDPGLGVTQYGYNGLNALTSVSDPRALVTGYTVDGLGNLTRQVSPDTGTTTSTHDLAGNLLTQTDAKGQVTTYAYDALNRVIQIAFHDGSKQAYVYDQGSYGIGRLSSITERDPAGQETNQTSYTYDQHGRVLGIGTAHAGILYTVGYSYDGAGRLSGLTYPSGRTVSYSLDALGRVSGIVTAAPGQSPQAVVSNVVYHPFGGIQGYTLGNGQAYSRSIDLDGRISAYTLGSQTFGIGYDAAGRIEFIAEAGSLTNRNDYGYDALDRLTSASTPGVPYAYSYDAVGNRTSKTVGAATEAYAYSATSNRIAAVGVRSFAFDTNGSTLSDGNNTYAYDTRGRMVQAASAAGTTHYRINALGQRMRKTNSQGDTVFHYETGGKLIAETDPAGGVKREFFYLGDIPVMVFQ
jgi:YD repeat-containing protein